MTPLAIIVIPIIVVAVLVIFIASSHARITETNSQLDALHTKLKHLESDYGKVVDKGMGKPPKVSGK